MKRKLSILTAAVMIAALLAGCGGGSAGTTSSGGADGAVVLSVGTEATIDDSLYYITLSTFKALVEEKTGGAVEVKIYPNSELGDELSMLEQTRSGNLDAVIIGGANFASLVPELQILSVPYLFRDFDAFQKGMDRDSELWSLLVDAVADKNAGVQLVAPTTIGSRWVVNSAGEVSTPDDFRSLGLKMRVQSNPVESTVWSTFGATPTNMPMTDVFTAMQQGVCNAVENAPDLLYSYKIHEVAPYFSATDHNWYFAAVVAGDAMFDKIPAEHHDAVREAFLEAGESVIAMTPNFQQQSIDALEEAGAIVNHNVDKDAFRALILDLYDEVAADCGGEEILAAINRIS